MGIVWFGFPLHAEAKRWERHPAVRTSRANAGCVCRIRRKPGAQGLREPGGEGADTLRPTVAQGRREGRCWKHVS